MLEGLRAEVGGLDLLEAGRDANEDAAAPFLRCVSDTAEVRSDGG